MLAETKAALSAAKKYKPKGFVEEHTVEFVRALLTDAVTRLELLPAMVESHALSAAVLDAERALEAAQAAQRG